MMTTDNKITIAVNGRLRKEKSACVKLRKPFIANINLPIKNRHTIPHSVIGSILLYNLHIPNLNKTNYACTQSCYSNCIREITNGIIKFEPTANRKQINK